ncbi:MAG: sodium-dependent transporter, partial [Moraxellaceae bacterium]
FSTSNAIALVDIIDHFINNIGIVLGALISIVLVSWLLRGRLQQFAEYSNAMSSIPLGRLWRVLLTVVTPLSLLVALALTMQGLLSGGYGSYPAWLVLGFGWGSVLCCLIGALLLNYLPEPKQPQADPSEQNP